MKPDTNRKAKLDRENKLNGTDLCGRIGIRNRICRQTASYKQSGGFQ
jgi:hypothetical protein